MKKVSAIALAALVAVPAASVLADNPDPYKTGPWHYRSIACVDTTVVSVTPRLGEEGQTKFTAQDFKDSGVSVTFKTTLGSDPAMAPAQVYVTHYQGDPDNALMIAEHPGDKVQVCFLSTPAPTQYCDPDKDPRGRLYRVWDYLRKKQYSGGSQHGCGGA